MEQFLKTPEKEYTISNHYLDILGVSIIVIDINGDITLLNKKGYETLDLDPNNSVIGRNWSEIIFFTNKNKRDKIVDQFFNGEISEYNVITEIATIKNAIKLIDLKCISIIDNTNKFTGILCSGEDITKQYKYKQDLIFKEQVLDNIRTKVIAHDFDGNIKYVNNSAKSFIENNSEKLNFKKVYQNFYSEYFNTVSKILKNKNEYTFEIEFISEQFITSYYEIRSYKIKYFNETLILSLIYDITDKRSIETKIFKTIIKAQEIERKRISEDLHDGIGPVISGIKLYINLLCNSKTNESERVKYLEFINNEIDRILQSLRQIANNITPTTIKDFGLITSLMSFIDKINKTNTIKILFEYNSIKSLRFDENTEINIFRILCELINNTLKYARASTINICISYNNNILAIDYSDNGIGIKTSIDKLLSGNGMGMKNIISRIKSLNGKYNFDNKENT
ncbi:MAG: PAS domain-containing protein, partial [Bacteroidota bacterium]|nr:PAS domain-containing protein [Bacteroidota bacterium]